MIWIQPIIFQGHICLTSFLFGMPAFYAPSVIPFCPFVLFFFQFLSHLLSWYRCRCKEGRVEYECGPRIKAFTLFCPNLRLCSLFCVQLWDWAFFVSRKLTWFLDSDFLCADWSNAFRLSLPLPRNCTLSFDSKPPIRHYKTFLCPPFLFFFSLQFPFAQIALPKKDLCYQFFYTSTEPHSPTHKHKPQPQHLSQWFKLLTWVSPES